MILTKKQELGVKIAVKRYLDKEKYTCIAGYAGTGKSTLVNFIVDALQLDPNRIAYVAYTGKAAQVLQNKGCLHATTVHKLLFEFFPLPNGRFIRKRKNIHNDYDLIVVDEVSMLPEELWSLMLSQDIYIIAMGDPGQLPSINDMGCKILQTPHIFLDEVMRQAKDSEIIVYSEKIRKGDPLKLYKGNEIQIIPKKELVSGMFTWADQVICGKNETRRMYNNLCRRLKWGEEYDLRDGLQVGDKIICLKNNWDMITEAGDALVNGTTGECTRIEKKMIFPTPYYDTICHIDFCPDSYSDEVQADQIFRNLSIDWKLISEGQETITRDNFKYFYDRKIKMDTFDYGYCITCHKAQGSEYSNVLVLAERLRATPYERWLYTAITRAKEKLIVVV